MSFDPIQEDCLRLILQDMRRKRVFPLENPAFIERDMDVYSQDPARLIKTDEDRSFHLTTRAAEMVDYRIPFVTDEAEIDRMSDEAEGMLREAAELDPSNWDARRMLSALVAQSNDEYVSYLLDAREEVEHDCALMVASAQDPYSREFAAGIGRNRTCDGWRPSHPRRLSADNTALPCARRKRASPTPRTTQAMSGTPACSPWQNSRQPAKSSPATVAATR